MLDDQDFEKDFMTNDTARNFICQNDKPLHW